MTLLLPLRRLLSLPQQPLRQTLHLQLQRRRFTLLRLLRQIPLLMTPKLLKPQLTLHT